jgi:nitroreductase
MDLYEAIMNRRSHRFFKPEMPPREKLEKVVNAALWAPSGTNAQPWEITVLAGRFRDEFVERASHCIAQMIPLLKAANVPEKGQEMVIKFFKDLGGAPVVIAITITRLEDPGMMDRPQFCVQGIAGLPGQTRPAPARHDPHRLLRQRAPRRAPQRPGSTLDGV